MSDVAITSLWKLKDPSHMFDGDKDIGTSEVEVYRVAKTGIGDEVAVTVIFGEGETKKYRKDIFLRCFEPACNTPKAVQILNEASAIMAERGKSYDSTGQGAERSMEKIVTMFNALTGHNLTVAQGWKFMCCLKLARSEQGERREDNYLDGAAYFALAGETASEDE